MIDIKAKVNVKIFSDKTVDVIGKSVLNIYGGMVQSVDSAAVSKTSKGSKGTSNKSRNANENIMNSNKVLA